MIEFLRIVNFMMEIGVVTMLFQINFESDRYKRMSPEDLGIRLGLSALMSVLALSGAARLWSGAPADWSLPALTVVLFALLGALVWKRSRQLIKHIPKESHD